MGDYADEEIARWEFELPEREELITPRLEPARPDADSIRCSAWLAELGAALVILERVAKGMADAEMHGHSIYLSNTAGSVNALRSHSANDPYQQSPKEDVR